MKKVLIIGGNGYVGSRLCSDFKDLYAVTSLDNTLIKNNPYESKFFVLREDFGRYTDSFNIYFNY